jgi:uncharacterized protein (TIGR00288 family)
MHKFINAPHRGETPGLPTGSPNAALLIDFDNVTMGIRSDLTSQMKDLLNSDIIRGKVAVQRAYADWRRYAQYIVPLSEASVDLIFAPAYGSSKKNATDIRLAIDALELVFTRPEIGVYILLSGDSDFSSLVLKLKEYGKYVIGVGLRESASDLLVQNCDEYYSYSSLTGLTKAGEQGVVSEHDPWDLAEQAIRKMADETDVMRSDRLKQVMLEIDPNFDEGEIGYSKFNKFLVEAASRNRLALRKLDNGQYEVQPFDDTAPEEKKERRPSRGGRRGRERQPETRRQAEPAESRSRKAAPTEPQPRPQTRERRDEDLKSGYELLQRAVSDLIDGPGKGARDSDIKRQMLEIRPGWDESELGFTKFSRFLRQAHDAEVIDLQRTGEGYYLAHLPGPGGVTPSSSQDRPGREDRDTQATRSTTRRTEEKPPRRREERQERTERVSQTTTGPTRGGRDEETPDEAGSGRAPAVPAERPVARAEEPEPEKAERAEPGPGKPEARESEQMGEPEADKARHPTYGRRGRRGSRAEGPPPLLPGQVVGGAGDHETPAAAPSEPREPEPEPEAEAAARAAVTPPAPQAEPAPEPEPEADQPAATDPVTEVPGAPGFDADELGLPTEAGAVIRYLSNSYQGVGQKTAEALIDAFGADRVFNGLNSNPDRVREVLGGGRRTEVLLEAWQRDYRRRTSADVGENQPVGDTA